MRRFGSCDLVASRFLAFLPFLTLSSGSTGESLCPAPDPISPCTCESNGIVDCSRANTSEEISSAFGNVTWPSTRLSVFRLMNNEGVKCLPEGIFGNVSFQEIHVLRTGLVTVDPSALLTSKDRLEYLSISNSLLEEFPFHILPRMTHLATLRLASNALRRVPALASSSLRDVMLFGNRIDALEPGWSTPGLESLDISYNPVYKLIPGLFEGMPNFKSFLASACNLGPVLLNGTLAFHSDALIAVFLQDNNIERLEPGAITGLNGNVQIFLDGNKITDVTDGSFRSILEVLASGEDGAIILWRNPIKCDSWIRLDPDFTWIFPRLSWEECLLCPDQNAISPCTCSSDETFTVTMDCSHANSSEIYSAFNDVPSFSAVLASHEGRRRFSMRNNWVVKDLRERIFGNMTFDEIHIWNTNLVALDPSAVLSSKDRLESLTISHSLLEEFPFRVLPRMTRLRTLHLSHGFLKSVPALESPSLKNLLLWNNEIHALEPRWSMPVLERLDISHNPISDLPPGMVEGMRNLMSFDASHCNLGPVLRNGSLAFQSKSLAKIFLQENDIVKLEPGAITGLRNDTRLDLRGNKIRNLTEGSFRPMLEHLSSGTSGFIFLWGNPVICDEWLVRSPDFKKFLQRLEGVECVSKSSKSPAK